jgi:hypothetical protein
MFSRIYSLVGMLILVSIIVGQSLGEELLENGSFEDDGVGLAHRRSLTGWDEGRGAANDLGFFLEEHILECDENGCVPELGVGAGELPEPVGQGAVKPNGSGELFGHSWGIVNGTGTLGSATQIVSVVENQGIPYQFSAWLASRSNEPPLNDTDYAIVSLEFFSGADGTGESLGSATFDGNDAMSPFIVGSLNAEGVADPTVPASQDNWTFYRTTGLIPELAQSAAVVIRGATISGSGRSGYVDLVSLQVVPEPGSRALVTACFLALLLFASTRILGHFTL